MKLWTPTGAALGLSAVALGAVGAHAVPLDDHARALFETANRYHFYHAIALVLTGVSLGHVHAWLGHGAGMAFLMGTVLFSGSLYLTALHGPNALGFLAPVGGTLLMAGWLLLALAALVGRKGR
ncbi:MAG: DUF423 domain-containing protein [Alphaproteobacteria bacterium]|nr:DUF423 domain-containing protein [Alphaproteobacteria bacterium]